MRGSVHEIDTSLRGCGWALNLFPAIAADSGTAETREAAMAAFKTQWTRRRGGSIRGSGGPEGRKKAALRGCRGADEAWPRDEANACGLQCARASIRSVGFGLCRFGCL